MNVQFINFSLMIKSIFILLSVFLIDDSYAQVETHTPAKTQEEYNLEKDEIWKSSIKNIEQLKSGSLLVALDFKTKKVGYYRKYDNHKAADKLAAKQKELNHHIIHAVDSLYKFSSFQYFDIDDLDKVKVKNFDEITFYNSKGEKDESIKFPEGFFLIGNFGLVSEEYSDDNEYRTKNNVNAFVIRDSDLIQLNRPFPYYSTFLPNTAAKKRYILPIRRFQEDLEHFEKTGEARYVKREIRRSEKRVNRKKRNQAKNQ